MSTYTRDFTATTFIVKNSSTLLLWHNKIEAWLPPGGHIEENELPEKAALREVKEETGLDVELLGAQRLLDNVKVLHTPVCILLEDISEGHQHIDIIYFARIKDGKPRINPREASKMRWFSSSDLEDREIADDIRQLGQQAIAACFPTKKTRP
ncbi:MAG: ADP-ribose pyrophosphatase YjhB (NUDIX family) [Planctomycetota bacterium]